MLSLSLLLWSWMLAVVVAVDAVVCVAAVGASADIHIVALP